MTPEECADHANNIARQVARVIVGQRELIEDVLLCLLAEGHVLLEGVPGLGKTQLLKTLAETLDLPWSRIQFTPDLMPADIVGTQILQQSEDGHRELQFRPGPITANLVLADEVNRATPKTQAAMLEAMQERAVTVAGETRPLPRPFMVMATQNPLEMEGTYPLPEAQLDRFLLKALVPFPTAEDLVTVIERTTGAIAPSPERVCDAETLRSMIALTREVPVPDHVVRHAVDLVIASHPGESTAPERVRRYVRFGASPRGIQAMILAGKARAILDGRPSVSIDDVRGVAPAALRHRLVVGYEATADATTADDLVATILDAVPAPTSGIRGAQ
ncbi:MAG: MoxR family ATPase [Acidimicrobiales bacterium]